MNVKSVRMASLSTNVIAASFATLAAVGGARSSDGAVAVAPVAAATFGVPGGGPLSCSEVEALLQSAIGNVEDALATLEGLPPNPNLLQITAAVTSVTGNVTAAAGDIATSVLSLELIQLSGGGCPTVEALVRILQKLTDVDALLDFVTAQLPLLLNPLLPPSQFNNIKNGIIDSLQNTVDFLEAALLQIGEPAPGNDSCSGATATTGSSIPFTTIGATDSGLFPLGCAGLIPPLAVYDVWFAYTPACDGTATASVCGANFDTVLAVYGGSCDNLVLVGCNDDGAGCGEASSAGFETVCGQTYYVRIGGYNEQGSGSLTISCNGTACPAGGGGDPVPCDELAALLGDVTATAGRAVDKLEALPCDASIVEVVQTVGAINGQIIALGATVAQAVASLEALQALGEGCPTVEAILRALVKLASVDGLLAQAAADLLLLLDPLLPPDECDKIKQGIVVVLDDVIEIIDAVIAQITASPCIGDLNHDGIVDGADLGILLAGWNQGGIEADLNKDGLVDGADLGILLAAWGTCPM